MIHPNTELRFVNETIGYGVFATHLIPRGTITWVRDDLDQAFSQGEMEEMGEAYQKILEKYSFVDGRGQKILCWDLARYVNHSCNANCLSAGYDFEMAVRDIKAGEELTDDYGTLNLETSFDCACEFAGCRRKIHPDDLLRYSDDWDHLVRAAFARLRDVPQPLWLFLREQEEILRALQQPQHVRSSRHNYYAGAGSLALLQA